MWQEIISKILLCLLLNYFLTGISASEGFISKDESLCKNGKSYLQSDIELETERAKEALQVSRISGNKNKIAECLINLADIYYKHRLYDKSLKSLVDCYTIYQEMRCMEGIAYTRNKIGLVQLKLDKNTEALTSFQNALAVFKELDLKDGIASCVNHIGLTYQKKNEHVDALGYFIQAKRISANMQYKYLLKEVFLNMGTSYFYISQFDSASHYLTNSIVLQKESTDLQGEAIALNSLAMVRLREKKSEIAVQLLANSLDISKSINYNENIIEVWMGHSINSSLNNNVNEARKYLDSCFVRAVDFQLLDHLHKTHENLTVVFNDVDKYKDFEKLYNVYFVLSNEIRVAQKNKERVEIEKELQIAETRNQKLKAYVLFFLPGFFLVTVILIFITERNQVRYDAAIERTIIEQEKIRHNSVIEASEQERKRISRDLHDSINYMLSTAKLNMSGLEDDLTKYSGLNTELLDNSIQLIDEAVEEVRNISHNLMPGSLTKLGLIAAVKDLFTRVNQSDQIQINFEYSELMERLDEKTEIALFRIIQESLNNIIKHSCASQANFCISKNESSLSILIADNGKGFDPEIINKSSGMGWKNIYSRAQMIGAKVEIESKSGECTKILVQHTL